MSSFCKKTILACFAVLLLMPLLIIGTVSASDQKQYVYDHANLLTKEEIGKLEALADKLGAKRKTDFLLSRQMARTVKTLLSIPEIFMINMEMAVQLF